MLITLTNQETTNGVDAEKENTFIWDLLAEVKSEVVFVTGEVNSKIMFCQCLHTMAVVGLCVPFWTAWESDCGATEVAETTP